MTQKTVALEQNNVAVGQNNDAMNHRTAAMNHHTFALEQKPVCLEKKTVVVNQNTIALIQKKVVVERNNSAWRQKREKNAIFPKYICWGTKPAGSNRLACPLMGHMHSKNGTVETPAQRRG